MKLRQVVILLLISILVGVSADAVLAGGWAVLTLTELPQEVVAERPFDIQFAVRQHGKHLLPGLSPTVTAVHVESGTQVSMHTTEDTEPGFYRATLTLPLAGAWQWTIKAFTAEYTMPPLTVQAAGTASPALVTNIQKKTKGSWSLVVGAAAALVLTVGWPLLLWQRRPSRWRLAGAGVAALVCLGSIVWQWPQPQPLEAQLGQPETEGVAAALGQSGEALFVAKGCIQCHQNSNVTMAQNLFQIGPNLTNYQGSPEFLHMWLADPAAVKPETQMPNLGLSEAEIETLATFLSTVRSTDTQAPVQ